MTPDAFEELIGAEAEQVRRPRGRAWAVASAASVAVGALVVAGALLAATLPAPVAAGPASTPEPPAPASTPSVEALAVESLAPEPVGSASVTALVDARSAADLAERTGIPPRAMLAYLGAALKIAEQDPSCGLGWNTLAGIGFVESEHGTHNGSRIDDDGVTRPSIVGIALDGSASNVIRDTDGGALDGDIVWDRAVGPMQFIPSTWAEWGSDGDGDGLADPQNIDDSALAASRYLCFAGGDLTVASHWITAVAAYNDAIEYNNRVAEAATHYANVANT